MKTLIPLLLTLFIIFIFVAALFIRPQDNVPALKDLYKGSFMIGGALNDDVVSGNDPKAATIAVKHFNTITSENEMKWMNIHPEPRRYNFEAADRFVEFGMKNNMFIVGHTLVWQNQIPRWAFVDKDGKMLDREAMLARMKDHIDTIVGRYKGKVKGWDVVNEALRDEGGLRDTKFTQTIGNDYVAKAFEYANAADPDAELYYNDFSIEEPAKRAAVVELVKDLKKRGVRIDGVGIQGHWGMGYPTRENFDAFMTEMTALGMRVMVTELDVDVLPTAFQYSGADINMTAELHKSLNPYPAGLPDSVQQKLANRYSMLFTMLLDYSDKIDRVTFWGVYDQTSWLNGWPVRGRTNYPLLFDRKYQPKQAFHSVVKAARERQKLSQ